MNGARNKTLKDHPHPGPLPQERVNNPPPHNFWHAVFLRMAFNELTDKDERQGDLQINQVVRRFSLSPGERGRVRASVTTDS
jgi:hypothetical protein